MLYLDHIEGRGTDLFDAVCERDLEGIVAKPRISPYREVSGRTTWLKIKNPEYSQAKGRAELFNKQR